MKKIAIIIILLGSFSSANAQDIQSKKGENYLPETGDWAIGFGTDGVFKYLGNAFNGNVNNNAPSLSNVQEGSFVGKKFITDKKAIRIIANFEFSQTKFDASAEDNNNVINQSSIKLNRFNLELGVGKEWRKGETRLQGFYGSDVFLTMNSGSQVITEGEEQSYEKLGMSYGIGINGFIGAEYFIFPKMALGAKYSYGARFVSQGKYENKDANEVQGDSFSGSVVSIGGVGIGSINLTLHF